MRLRATRLTSISRGYRNAAMWTPARLGPSVVSMWFDASDAGTITLNGSTVAQWDDKSGNSKHAVQATAANQPTYIASDPILYNKPTVNVPTDAGLIGLTTPTAAYQEVYCVGYYGNGAETLATNNNTMFSGQGSFNYERVFVGGGTATLLVYSAGSNFTGTVYKDGNPVGTNVLLPLPPTSMRFRRDSLADVNQSTNLQYSSLTGGRNFRGSISEWIFVSGSISTQDRQRIEGYLAWKWGGL